MNNLLKKFAFALLLGAASTSAPALAEPITLSGDVKLEKIVTDETGAQRTELVEPEIIVPGDRLIFITRYHNSGAETVTDFVVTNPIPAAVQLADDADSDLIVSVDGGASWGKLADLTKIEADGTSRPALHSDATHVRWVLAEVQSSEHGALQYPVTIR